MGKAGGRHDDAASASRHRPPDYDQLRKNIEGLAPQAYSPMSITSAGFPPSRTPFLSAVLLPAKSSAGE